MIFWEREEHSGEKKAYTQRKEKNENKKYNKQ